MAFPHRTLIAVAGVVVLVLIIFGFICLSGSRQFPSVMIEVFKLFRLQSGEVVGPSEERYSLDFDNQPLSWAVARLNKMASNVNIVLHPDLKSGAIKTKRFNVHLNGATLEEMLDVFCANAAKETNLVWLRDGKSVFIEPKNSSSITKVP